MIKKTDLKAKSGPPVAPGMPEPELAEQAIGIVLQPLARLMIDHGLQLPAMVELLKRALITEGENTDALSEKESSDTRISILTGVHRKDVKRLRQATSIQATHVTMVGTAASVVARWISEPRFMNADQSPRALARTPARGRPGEPDFTTLVAEVSRDVGARAVLDELERLGVVASHDDGYLNLVSAAFVPHEGLKESFHFLANNVGDHFSAAVHNLDPRRRDALQLEQSAYSGNLSVEQAGHLNKLARRLWANALQQFLQMATVAEQRSLSSPGPKRRVRFGVYFHDAEQVKPALKGNASKTKAAKTTRRAKA